MILSQTRNLNLLLWVLSDNAQPRASDLDSDKNLRQWDSNEIGLKFASTPNFSLAEKSNQLTQCSPRSLIYRTAGFISGFASRMWNETFWKENSVGEAKIMSSLINSRGLLKLHFLGGSSSVHSNFHGKMLEVGLRLLSTLRAFGKQGNAFQFIHHRRP